MAVQDHHHHHDEGYERSTTVVSGGRNGPAAALIAVIAVLLVAFLIWFFAFSGVVFNRHAGPTGSPATRIEQNTRQNGTAPSQRAPATSIPSARAP